MATIIGWTAVERELRRRRPGWTIETAFWIDAGAVPVLHCHVVRRCGSSFCARDPGMNAGEGYRSSIMCGWKSSERTSSGSIQRLSKIGETDGNSKVHS